MNSESPNHFNSNLNSSEEVYLNLVHSYINATREMLNGYMTFETGLTRAINSQIFRNFTRSSLSAERTRPTVTTQPESVQTEPEPAAESVQTETETQPILETPVNLIRREIQHPNTPTRPTFRFRSTLPSTSSMPSSPFQIPTPVRLTSRLDTPPQERERENRIRRVLQQQQQQQQQQQSQSESNSMVQEQEHEPLSQTESQNGVTTSTSIPTPPFSSSFVRYRLPVAIGPPRRAPSTNINPIPSASSHRMRAALEVPIISPANSPPPPQPPPPPSLSLSPTSRWTTQTWQRLQQNRQQRQQEQQQLNSLSPILPVEPTPLPPAPALAPLTTATRLMLNLMDTPRLNDTLVYYTQIIDREIAHQVQENSPLSYDVIQQQTKIIPYCTISEPLNDFCPISQVSFDLIDSVMQINRCKHNFNPYSLLRWFDSHSTCPLCRREVNVNYDDRDERNERDDREDDEQTIHMYNNGREEEPYRSTTELNRHYDDSDVSSVG